MLFCTRALSSATRWPQSSAHSSQVRPFHEDDEAAHEHIRKLAEALLHDGDFPYEDITGQDEPPIDNPIVPRETAQRPNHQDAAEKNQWKWSQTYGNEREEKH